MTETGYECDGCDSPTSVRTMWLIAPLGLTVVHVCSRECAITAREKRGGGRFLPREPMPAAERLVRQARGEDV